MSNELDKFFLQIILFLEELMLTFYRTLSMKSEQYEYPHLMILKIYGWAS